MGFCRAGLRLLRLIGIGVRFGQLIGRQRSRDVPTRRQREFLLRFGDAPALIVLLLLGGLHFAALRVAGGGNAPGEPPDGKVILALRAELRGVIGVLDQRVGAAGATAVGVTGRRADLDAADAPQQVTLVPMVRVPETSVSTLPSAS